MSIKRDLLSAAVGVRVPLESKQVGVVNACAVGPNGRYRALITNLITALEDECRLRNFSRRTMEYQYSFKGTDEDTKLRVWKKGAQALHPGAGRRGPSTRSTGAAD